MHGGGDLTELLNLKVCFVCQWDDHDHGYDYDYDEVCNLIAVRSLSIKLPRGVAFSVRYWHCAVRDTR